MPGAIVAGLLAAVVVSIQLLLEARYSQFISPVMILGVAAIAMVLQRFIVDRRSGSRVYDGLADLLIHIHSPSSPDSSLRWSVRSVISFLLSLCGAMVGAEGAAVEACQAYAISVRERGNRWFEQRRRTDASAAIAAGVSAAFSAPFAGLLLPIELGMGGRYMNSALSALLAFAGVRYLDSIFHFPARDFSGALLGMQLGDGRVWLIALLVGGLAGAMSALLIRFFRYTQDSLLDLFQTQTWMRTLAAGVLLFLVILAYRAAHLPSYRIFEDMLWGRLNLMQTGLMFCSGVLALAVILAGFGTLGVFWPLFALGGSFGFVIHSVLTQAVPGLGAIAGLSGGVAFWAAFFGAPISGAVLAYELTQDLNVLLPCLLAGLVARQVRQWLRIPTLVDSDLRARGMALLHGRSASVMESVSVRDAMVTDHEIVHEQEPIAEIYPRLLKSRYPFLPVVNSQNAYTGLITVDMVQEAWQSQSMHTHVPLAKLLEAKDLLYRSGLKTPTVKVNDRLSVASAVFDKIPCAPVLSDDGRVVGLLFIHSVRLAYDREVARQSLSLEGQKG